MKTLFYFAKSPLLHPTLKKFYLAMTKYQGELSKFNEAIVKLGRYPVRFDSEIRMGLQAFKSTSLTKTIDSVDLPIAMFEIPADYKQVPINMTDFRMAFLM